MVAVKEVPADQILPGRPHLFFSHTVKGQEYNMPLLQHVLDVKATLIDYERIADEQNRRLIFFSVHAGYAGTIETLRALGLRLAAQGRTTPLAEVKQPHEYPHLDAAKDHLRDLGGRIADEGLGTGGRPLVFGVAGYGNVAKGCREILECLPVREIAVEELADAAGATDLGSLAVVTFREEHMVEPRNADAQFVLQDYYQRPENYRGVFARHLPYLDVLLNTIYWEERYPRLVTASWAKTAYGGDEPARLQVIGDISCDIEGSIELTLEAMQPDEPNYVWDPATRGISYGVEGKGPVIMAVDNLPCELPREASQHFSTVLREMVPALADADFAVDFAGLNLPSHLKKAVIAHGGRLTPDYRYLQEFLEKAGR
jgi:alpha-aminoadipic semialdehyde synthase